MAEERRRLDAGKRPEIRVVQKIERLRVELESILLRGRARHGRRRGPITATKSNHSHLRPARLLLFRSKTLAPAQARADFPTRSATRAVASNAERPIVDRRVAVVVEPSGDVVRQR